MKKNSILLTGVILLFVGLGVKAETGTVLWAVSSLTAPTAGTVSTLILDYQLNQGISIPVNGVLFTSTGEIPVYGTAFMTTIDGLIMNLSCGTSDLTISLNNSLDGEITFFNPDGSKHDDGLMVFNGGI